MTSVDWPLDMNNRLVDNIEVGDPSNVSDDSLRIIISDYLTSIVKQKNMSKTL